MKLWHIEFVLSDKHLHDTVAYLEGKAYNLTYKIIKNGAGEEKQKSKTKGNGRNIKAISAAQQEWVVKTVKSEMTPPELRGAWAKTDFRDKGLYGALMRAVKNKTIKRLASGNFKPVGGA